MDEVFVHYSDSANNPKIDSFLLVVCCIEKGHLHEIERLDREGEITRHRESIQRNQREMALRSLVWIGEYLLAQGIDRGENLLCKRVECGLWNPKKSE
jgi:hypothetical protein